MSRKCLPMLDMQDKMSRLRDRVVFEIAKGLRGTDEDFDAKFVEKMIKDNELDVTSTQEIC